MSETSSTNSDNSVDNIDVCGRVKKNYAFIKRLGTGKFASVWLAYNIDTNDFVAIKIYDPKEYSYAKEEVSILKKLKNMNCSHLNKMCDYFEETLYGEKTIYIVTELLGFDLDLIRKANLSENVVLKFSHQILKGINELHNNNVIHCDIKPDNIMLTELPKSIKRIICEFKTYDFRKLYSEMCKIKNPKTSSRKKEIREKINKYILLDMNIYEESESESSEESKSSDSKSDCSSNILSSNNKYEYILNEYTLEDINNSNIKISDFGNYCIDDEFHEKSIGTQYYIAPENLLHIKHDNKIDIWAYGCTLYEILFNIILFDPKKDKYHSTKYYHLLSIQQKFGEYPSSLLDKCTFKNKYFKGNYIEDSIKCNGDFYDTLKLKCEQKKVSSLFFEKFSSFLRLIFVLNPKKRLTSSDLLNHELFR
jgi:serine/threonine-protein kinase SRPK3